MDLTVSGKQLIFSAHAQMRFDDRGTTSEEVKQTLEKGKWVSAKGNRQETQHVFPFGKDWKGNRYETKTVNPVFVVEGNTITVITIYVFYGGKVAKK